MLDDRGVPSHFRLKSISRQVEWQPGVHMSGDIKVGYGVFAWNNKNLCHSEAMTWLRDGEEPLYVVGTVKLWGEVVEHEHGYRAEFAEINTIDGAIDSMVGHYHPSETPMWHYLHHFSFKRLCEEYLKC